MHPKVVAFKEPSAIPISLKTQIIVCYHDYFPPRIFKRKDPNDWFERDANKPVRFVMLGNQTILSHGCVITREVEVNEVQFNLAGLGGIFTRVGHRKKGLGTRVVRTAMEYMNSNNYDIAVLFCLPKNQQFYKNLDWQVLRNQHILVGKDKETAKPLPKKELCMIRYLSEKSKRYKPLFEKMPIFFGEEW